MEGTPHPVPRTVEEVFSDFRGRRAGLLKALTADVEKFYQQCDPVLNLVSMLKGLCVGLIIVSACCLVEKENLCLYGLPNETWEVNLPVEEVPPELPEPALGINFARDGMQEKDWLSLVAVHSDSWLLSVAFYFGARFGFGKSESLLEKSLRYQDMLIQIEKPLSLQTTWNSFCLIPNLSWKSILYRKRLFQMINDLPTVFEVVTGAVKQTKDQNNGNRNRSSNKMPSRQPESQPKAIKMADEEDESGGEEEEEDDEQGATCGACGDNYANDEFWICCDICERWFHGKCVKITPAKAEHIKQYKCPTCSSKRARV
ncbi:PHD finger family protein [Striga asiatica]|uniref:PHD finger protein ALFIN-LIKE n=1 Tax=Striga asiatica TaxID=4170 RepID=A0A5A7QK34_STRAF|nr:PHD finger family protein [Striga asiatica]